MTPKKLFTFFATAEGFTWAALLATLAARSFTPVESVLLTSVGGVHGAVFLGYAVSAALVGVNQRWSFATIVLGITLAIVPFATIPFELRLKKRSALEGQWRLEASAHPADKSWFDRLFRWFINRPFLLLITMAAVVAAIFALLLFIGPPDQWGK